MTINRAVAIAFMIAVCLQRPIYGSEIKYTTTSFSLITTQLLSGTDAERTKLATDMQLVIPKWTTWKTTHDTRCTVFKNANVNYIRLKSMGEQAVLRVYSDICEYTYLVLFDRVSSQEWMRITTVPLWSRLGEPVISFDSLIQPDVKEIVASNCTVDAGTGVRQSNLIVLKLYDGGIVTVFDRPQEMSYKEPINSTQNINQSQTSKFDFVSTESDHPVASIKQIVETELVSDHEARITRHRLYIWVPELRVFQGVATF